MNHSTVITEKLQDWMLADEIPGIAYTIVEGTHIQYIGCLGVKSLRKQDPVTPETQFVLGSTTKSITALAILLLVQQEKVELHAPVTNYIKWFRLATSSANLITVYQLITHTSGLGGREDPDTPYWRSRGDAALEDWVRELRKTYPRAKPGKKFIYSVDGYAALGVLIQEVTGLTFADYLEKYIFTPLGMRNTTARPDDANPSLICDGHYRFVPDKLEAIPPYLVPAYSPSGWVISTAQDVGRYLIFQLNGEVDGQKILSPELLTASHTIQVSMTPHRGYAFGWMVDLSKGLLEHEGQTAASSSAFILKPKKKLAVGLLLNCRDFQTIQRAEELLKIFDD